MSVAISDLLRDHSFCGGFWPEHVAKLAGLASEARFQPGELIFHEGDHSSLFYLLVSGNVALEVVSPGHPLRISTLVAGEVLGWSSLTGDTGKQFQARALEEVHAVAFDGARLRHACDSDFAFGFFLMRRVLAVMAERLHSIRVQLLDAYTPVGS